jgi:hypothetical protein
VNLIPTSAARRRWVGSRTVLGGKGSHSRAKPGRALASPAPFCRFADRDGRLRRESDTTRVRVVEDEEHEENYMEIHAIGIDLGKTVFHLVGVDAIGRVVVRNGAHARSC